MVPFIFGKLAELPLITVCKSFFHRVPIYEPGTIDMNKMLTSLSTIIERWNEIYLNQESSGLVRFKNSCFVFL